MKKLSMLLLSTIFLLLITNQAMAYQNEPNGFKDLYWGESLQEVQKQHLVKYKEYMQSENAVSYYLTLTDKDRYLSGQKITGPIQLDFWNDKLYRITIKFWEKDLIEMSIKHGGLKDSLIRNFGQPSETIDIDMTAPLLAWKGETTSISFLPFIQDRSSSFYFTYLLLYSPNLLEQARNNTSSQGW